MARETETVYVPLLDEGIDVWRPTEAELLPDGSYRLLPTPDYDPEDEHWEFPPGSQVICEFRDLEKGRNTERTLTAVRLAKSQRQSA